MFKLFTGMFGEHNNNEAIFDHAIDSEFKLDCKKPQQQHPQNKQ